MTCKQEHKTERKYYIWKKNKSRWAESRAAWGEQKIQKFNAKFAEKKL
jgi:hypothetical protein